jgi:NAD(P)H-dependent FMN reductase
VRGQHAAPPGESFSFGRCKPSGNSGRSSAVVPWVSCSILLVSGSVRSASTNTAVLRTAQTDAAPGTECVLYDELAELPHFNPDDDRSVPPPAVERLRDAVHRADAILFSTPEYAGAMPGALKNLLEWLIGDDQPGSVYEKPVGWVNCSPRGASLTYESLRTVLEYAHAHVIAHACGTVPVSGSSVGENGLLSDATARADVNQLVSALANAACPATPAL